MSDNPPAFPQSEWAFQGGEGMSLRDWFAGQALTTAVDRSYAHGLTLIQVGSPMHPMKVAEAAYRFADAMLAERMKPTPNHDAGGVEQ